MTLGIGIITYKRTKALIRTAGAVMWHTKSPYYLVVAEDGGEDDTVAHCQSAGVTVITGKNHGVCWNKNRAIKALWLMNADPIILLEDDCYPTKLGWEEDWVTATKKFGHMNYVHPRWPAGWAKSGSGTAEDPWRTWEITGQATSTTMAGIAKVGYLNTQFKGYGYGHINWTERFVKAGYFDRESVPCMLGGLEMENLATFANKVDICRNYHLSNKLRQEGVIYCNPCDTKDDMYEFDNEVYMGIGRIPPGIRPGVGR